MPSLRTVVVALLASSSGLAAGCGSSAGSNSNAGSQTPPPSRASAHAQYAGFAAAVNLRANDVPGFAVERRSNKHTHVGNAAFEDSTQYRRCFGSLREAKPVFKQASEQFKSGGALDSESVSSTVHVMRSVGTAEHELAVAKTALASASARDCLARVFDELGTQAQSKRVGVSTLRITVGNLGFVPIDVSAATRGTGGGYGFSMHMNIDYHVSARGRRLTVPTVLDVDALSFVLGRTQVSLGTITLGTTFPPYLEAELFSLLVSRARAASRFYRDVDT